MAEVDNQKIGEALGRVLRESEVQRLDADRARIVVFSDQHKGQGDKADDFKESKRAYHAALGYYLEAGYRLFALGDVEELWECRPGSVLRQYSDTLALEQEFHRQGRYVRFWGNHDDEWRHPASVQRHLHPLFGSLRVVEGLRLEVVKGQARLGTLVFAHGHQGTLDSDRGSKWSRFFVRVFWRNIQRLTGWRINTPATDFKLRGAHDQAMYDWAKQQNHLVLVVGHTHRPVFMSDTHLRSVEQTIAEYRATLGDAPNEEQRRKLASLHAELEWVKARDGAESLEADRPCYFNTGCCCFDDGDITGLEIDQGELRLVRWPDDEGRARPKVLRRASLPDVLGACPETGTGAPPDFRKNP